VQLRRCTRDCWLRLLSIILFISGLFLLLTAHARALDSPHPKTSTTADLTGVVATVDGASLAGATVALEDLATHRQSTAQSGANGDFNFAGLPAGEYRLRVVASGYKTYSVSQLPLVAGDRACANPIMEVGDASVIVEAKVGVISRAGTALVGKSISDLPENQRSFVNLLQNSAGANEGSTNGSASGSRPG
jgi:Carboxypeptidase regulatory-like domain